MAVAGLPSLELEPPLELHLRSGILLKMSVSGSADQDHSDSGFQKYEFDLTRLCLRRGMVELPGSMLGLFEAGEVVLRDPVGDQTHTLTFTPPRTLASLKVFFERHSLQPNDKLVLLLDDEGGEIHALRRPKKRSTAGRAVQLPPGEATPELIIDGPAQVREVRQRVREEGGAVPPQAPETDASALPRPAPTPSPWSTASYDAPLAPEPRPLRGTPEPVPPTGSLGPPHGASDSEPGGGDAEPVVRIMAFLAQPSTPIIVRVDDVAEVLGLPGTAALDALERIARDPESGLETIRQGIYRMSRQVQS